jgi:hypothetical protein
MFSRCFVKLVLPEQEAPLLIVVGRSDRQTAPRSTACHRKRHKRHRQYDIYLTCYNHGRTFSPYTNEDHSRLHASLKAKKRDPHSETQSSWAVLLAAHLRRQLRSQWQTHCSGRILDGQSISTDCCQTLPVRTLCCLI